VIGVAIAETRAAATLGSLVGAKCGVTGAVEDGDTAEATVADGGLAGAVDDDGALDGVAAATAIGGGVSSIKAWTSAAVVPGIAGPATAGYAGATAAVTGWHGTFIGRRYEWPCQRTM
jgi:hypothetical protein